MIRNRFFTSALLVAGSLSLAQGAHISGSINAFASTERTLQNLRTSALAAETDADELRMATMNENLGPEKHLYELNALKSEINTMGKELYALDQEHDSLAQWEQQTIDKTHSLLKDAAINTENAIHYFNENRQHLWAPAYREYADRAWQDSVQISKILKDSIQYGKARDQEQKLQGSVGVTGTN